MHIHYLPRYFGLWNSFDPPAWDMIASEDIPVNPKFIRSASFKKFYKFNFKTVYIVAIRRVSAIRKKLAAKFLDGTFFVDSTTFNNLQELY